MVKSITKTRKLRWLMKVCNVIYTKKQSMLDGSRWRTSDRYAPGFELMTLNILKTDCGEYLCRFWFESLQWFRSSRDFCGHRWVTLTLNCNCNWGTCIAPPTRKPRAHHRVNPYPAARRQNETENSDHDETSPSIAAVSAPSVACSTLAVHALSPVRRSVRGTTRLPHDEALSVDRPGILATDVRRSDIPACVPEATCEPASTACTGSSPRLATNATLEELESHGHEVWDPERCVPLRAGLARTVPVWKLKDRPARRCNSPGQLL